MENMERLSAGKLAKQLSNIIRHHRPDYIYLSEVFKHVRKELEVKVEKKSRKLPFVPTDEEMKRFYDVVWASKNRTHALMIKVMAYTGVRVAELVKLKLIDVDLESCQIRVIQGKGDKDRRVPFPPMFKETLALHMEAMRKLGSAYVFESNWKKPFSREGVRKMISNYSKQASLSQPLSPHKFRHFLLTYLKKQGIDDALIQPYSGHESRKSLEVYSRLSLVDAQQSYNTVISRYAL